MRQPSLFNFKPVETPRNSGLTPAEERELVGFCLSDNYPRVHTVERTGTVYKLTTPRSAELLLKALRYTTAEMRKRITFVAEKR